MYPYELNEQTIRDIGIRHRIAIERKIVTALIDRALAEGYELAVDDGDERHPWTRDRAEVLDTIMNTDEDYLYMRKDGACGWVFLVYGNAGYDVIANNTMSLEGLLAPVEALALSLEKDDGAPDEEAETAREIIEQEEAEEIAREVADEEEAEEIARLQAEDEHLQDDEED